MFDGVHWTLKLNSTPPSLVLLRVRDAFCHIFPLAAQDALKGITLSRRLAAA
ncbi:MAG: hypothetical protein U0872_15545 [Planctomycetaceae bacterium]